MESRASPPGRDAMDGRDARRSTSHLFDINRQHLRAGDNVVERLGPSFTD